MNIKRFYVLVVVFVALFSLRAVSQTVVGLDNAGNYTTWGSGDNQGTGFGPWNFYKTGDENRSGFFLGSSTPNFGDINTSGKSFGMWGNPAGVNYANAERHVSEWASGYSFEIDLAIEWTNGNKGIDIYANGVVGSVFTFNVVPNDKYQVNGDNLGWLYSQHSIFHLKVLQFGNHLKITLTRGGDSYSTVIANKEFSGFKVFVGDTQNGNPLNNIHFNNLVITSSTSLLFDDFNRDNSDIVGQPSSGVSGNWIETEILTANPNSDPFHTDEYIIINNNDQLEMRNCVNGHGHTGNKSAAFDMTGLYATTFEEADRTMEWYFNMRQSQTEPGGFGTNAYGVAYIIGADKSDFGSNTVSGYAVVLGESGNTDPMHLIHFTNGIPANPGSNAIASVNLEGTNNRNNYYSIKVTFDPCTEKWTLQVRDDGTSFFDNPLTIATTPSTGTNSAHINSDLKFMGAYYNHGSSCSGNRHAVFDNIYIPVASGVAPATYTWNEGDGSFSDPLKWTPSRDCARSTDRLEFNGGMSIVTDVPTQTISQLIIENSQVTFQDIIDDLSPSVLSIRGGAGVDFSIEASSTLFLNAATSNNTNDAVEISLLTGATGLINGSLVFQNTNSGEAGRKHRLIAADPNAVQVNGTVTALNLMGNPFGSATSSNDNIVFKDGSIYNYHSGANPFGLSQPASKVVFESGSKYVHHKTGPTYRPSLIGRKYADFEVNVSGTLDILSGGNSPWTVNNISIISGDFEILTSSLNIDINCKGNIHVLANQSFTINPTNHSTLSFTGTETQKIHGNGTLTFGNNVSMKVDNSASNGVGLILEKDITLNQDFTVENGKVQGTGTTLTMTGTNSTILVNDSIKGTNVGSGNDLNLVASGARTNITGNALARFFNITLEDNDTLAVSAGLESMHGSFTVSDNSKLMLNAGGYIANTSQGFSRSPNYSATSQLIYNTGNAENDPYGRFMEWTGVTNPGYPGNVIMQGETYVSTNNSGVVHSLALGVQNDLLIRSGTLNIEDNSEKVIIGGDVEIGTESTDGTLNLSFVPDGDLEVKGDFTLNENGTFNPNQRAVIFSSSADQTITSASNEINFDYMVVNKGGGDLLLSNSPGTTVNVQGSSGGDVLIFENGDINLQGQTFNLIADDPAPLLYVKVENDVRTITSHTMANFNIKGGTEIRTNGSGYLLFDDSVSVNISKPVNFGALGLTTVNATLQINTGGYAHVSPPRYGEDATLKYNTGFPYLRRVEWNGNAANYIGYPNDVIVAGNTILIAGGESGSQKSISFDARRNVTIEAGSHLNMTGDHDMIVPLKVGGDLTINGELSASNLAPGDIYVAGNWLRNSGGVFNPNDRQVLFNGSTPQTITRSGGETFDYLAFENAGTKTLNNDISVNKNLDILAGSGALQPGSYTIGIAGNWNNEAGSAAFTEGSSTVNFKGSTLQELSAVGGETFYAFQINNTGPGVKLMNVISISANLHFVQGLIDAKTYQVNFESNSTNSGASSESYINGKVLKAGFTTTDPFIFPVGDYRVETGVSGDSIINVYQPAAIIRATSGNSPASFTVDYNHNNYFPGYTLPNNPPPMDPLSLESVSTCNFWNINRISGNIGVKVRLYWTDACFDITEPENLLVAKAFDDGNGGEIWKSVGGPTTNGPFTPGGGYVETSVSVSAFSPFTIGSTGGINVLPIELLSFTASPKGQFVETHWVTSTEINNEYFTVERSVDAVNFTKVGRVQGAGNSTSELSYSFIDEAPYSGISYYRLKQTDFDGATTYSDIRSVRMDTDKRFELINVYRSEQGVNLTYRSDVEILQVEVFDMLGKRIYKTPVHNVGGVSTIGPSLVRGMYVLRLSNGVEGVSGKFFY